jgi:hypothetical protein
VPGILYLSAMKLLPFLLLLFAATLSAQTQFPVISFTLCDTVTEGQKCQGSVVIRNNSKQAIGVKNVTASVFGFQAVSTPTQQAAPGDSLLITFRLSTHSRAGAQRLFVKVALTNDSVVHQRLSYFVKPATLAAVPDSAGRTKAGTACPCDSAHEATYPGGTQAFVDTLVRMTNQQVRPVHAGRTVIAFTVNKEGFIVNPVVTLSVDPVYEAALLRNITKTGKWNPACALPQPYEPRPDGPCEGRKFIPMRVSVEINVAP